MKILKKYLAVWIGLIVVLVAVILLVCFLVAGKKPLTTPPETTASEPVVQIETAYATLDFPEALVDNIRHIEVSEGSVTMEIFYMLSKTGERELYRIIFGDANMGNPVGYLNTESGEVPVTVSFVKYEDVFEKDDRMLYGQLTDAFSTMLNSLCEDSRFSEIKNVVPVGYREAKLKYWSATIPENVQCEENGEGEGYRAEFFGIVDGERIPLYAVLLGKVENPKDVLGSYMVDGKILELGVVVYDISDYDNWAEEKKSVVYNMMNSINTVIQTIVEDKNFSS